MASNKTKRQRKAPVEDQREQILAVFASYVEDDDIDRLFDFMQHCRIDLEPLSDKKAQLDDIIAAHFYVRPGVYDIDLLANLLVTFPPIAARIRELKAEKAKAAQGCA